MVSKAVIFFNLLNGFDWPNEDTLPELADHTRRMLGFLDMVGLRTKVDYEAVLKLALDSAWQQGYDARASINEKELEAKSKVIGAQLALWCARQRFIDALRSRIGDANCCSKTWIYPEYCKVVFSCLECGIHNFHYPHALQLHNILDTYPSFAERHAHVLD